MLHKEFETIAYKMFVARYEQKCETVYKERCSTEYELECTTGEKHLGFQLLKGL